MYSDKVGKIITLKNIGKFISIDEIIEGECTGCIFNNASQCGLNKIVNWKKAIKGNEGCTNIIYKPALKEVLKKL